MAYLHDFTYNLKLAHQRDVHSIEVRAFDSRQATAEAYAEACKLGARAGNVEAFDLVRQAVAYH